MDGDLGLVKVALVVPFAERYCGLVRGFSRPVASTYRVVCLGGAGLRFAVCITDTALQIADGSEVVSAGLVVSGALLEYRTVSQVHALSLSSGYGSDQRTP